MLLPPSLEELIPDNHPVLVVNEIIDGIDLEPLLKKYKGGGTSSFHPRMMLKILVYAYLNNIYSSRKIESALKENINFMWLSGMSKPDHNTINRFRSERLKDVLKTLFAQVVILLNESGNLDVKDIYTDGTKIEANANRYTFVWRKAIQTSKERMHKQLEEIWSYAQNIAKEELADKEVVSFEEINSETVKQAIEQVNEAIKDKPVDKKVKQKINYAKRNWPTSLERYAKAEEVFESERNSYSKTDTDATFMRMKEDHMRNGQLKPGYNVQISSNNQYIVNYSIHPNPTDTKTLEPHMAEYEKVYGNLPKSVTADAGYGSQENYAMLEQKGIEAFVKYNSFDKELNLKPKSKTKKDPSKLENREPVFDEELNQYCCPAGKPLMELYTFTKKTSTGFKQNISAQQANGCESCPLKHQCFKGNGNRIFEINHELKQTRRKVKERLISEMGKKKRAQRSIDVEPVFANIKQNKQFKRFMLRGKYKVEIEWGLIALAHNLKKKSAV